MTFRTLIYLVKGGGFVWFVFLFATFLAPEDGVLGSVRDVVLIVVMLLGVFGGVLGFLYAIGVWQLRVRCPFCGARGEVGNYRPNLIGMKCPNCYLVYTTGLLGLNVARMASADSKDDVEEETSPEAVKREFDLDSPPEGAWFYENERGWRIGAWIWSPTAMSSFVFPCLFLGITVGGIYGSQLVSRQFDFPLTLSGIPFVLASLLLFRFAAEGLPGRVEVCVDGVNDCVFFGVGPIGWRRRFDWSEVKRVVEDGDVTRRGRAICLVGKQRLTFGRFVPDERLDYLKRGLQVLRKRAWEKHGDV